MNTITSRISMLGSRHALLLCALAIGFGLLSLYGAAADQASWEVELTRAIQAASPAPMRWVAHAMTAIGNWPIYPLMAAGAVVALVWARHRSLGLLVTAAALLRMVSPLLKDLVDRERPSPALVDVSSTLSTPAFPSGHVLSATLLFGVLIYVAQIAVPHAAIRRSLQAACVSMIVLMGYARVELGEHWPTDVLGGWAFGALLLVLLCRAHRVLAPVRA